MCIFLCILNSLYTACDKLNGTNAVCFVILKHVLDNSDDFVSLTVCTVNHWFRGYVVYDVNYNATFFVSDVSPSSMLCFDKDNIDMLLYVVCMY